MTVAALLAFGREYWVPIAVVVAVLAGLTWFGHERYQAGADGNELKHQRANTEQLGERNTTNEDVRKFSEARKCRSLGGVYRNDRCE